MIPPQSENIPHWLFNPDITPQPSRCSDGSWRNTQTISTPTFCWQRSTSRRTDRRKPSGRRQSWKGGEKESMLDLLVLLTTSCVRFSTYHNEKSRLIQCDCP